VPHCLKPEPAAAGGFLSDDSLLVVEAFPSLRERTGHFYQEQPPVVLSQRERAEIEEIGVAVTSEDANMPKRVADYVGEITTGVSAKPKP
jgi:hypothetical protein